MRLKRNAFYLFLSTSAVVYICSLSTASAEIGITNNKIIIGGVMDLKGRSKALGTGMRTGILAALEGKKIQGKSIEYITRNDSYNPEKTVAATNGLVNEGVFLMLGNVGTPTAKVSLPILAKNNVPAVGFFTGAGLLRPGKGNVFNYRASYVQETAFVINSALQAGVKTNEICAYVQNDAYGMAGVTGIKRALENKAGTEKLIKILDSIISMKGNNPSRNNIGPVGVYQRNTFTSRKGYLSLKAWEINKNTKCRVVLTVGSYKSVAAFIGYANMKKESWVYSAVSFTGAENLKNELASYGVHSKVIVTEVVPPLYSKLPIVADARKALGKQLGNITLEGYMVGRLVIAAMENIKGNITRESFVAAVKNKKIIIGGYHFDFTTDNQASNLVTPTYLKNGEYKVATRRQIDRLFN